MTGYVVRNVAKGGPADFPGAFVEAEASMGEGLAELRVTFAWPEELLGRVGGTRPAETLAARLAGVFRYVILHGPPAWAPDVPQGWHAGPSLYLRWAAGMRNPRAHWGPPWGASVAGRLDTAVVLREGLAVNPVEHLSTWELRRATPVPAWAIALSFMGTPVSRTLAISTLDRLRGRLLG